MTTTHDPVRETLDIDEIILSVRHDGRASDDMTYLRDLVAAGMRAAASEAEAVKVEAVAWPTMPPSRGQSPVLFEDGYAEGWAKCLSMCRQALATPSPSPAAAQAQEAVGFEVEPLDAKAIAALREVALSVFDGNETPQETRDVIEWFTSMLLVRHEKTSNTGDKA